ncbi:MAG: HAD-IA family hydrolase [Ectothiorhodospiraceae bacterium]|nr:HAD-IA family hydrolase [Ectothiorhodospiraceae bacterium]MCH8505405.1 HAD-IA family hydrolase [Ectothiorhodospiraceae bacterium]
MSLQPVRALSFDLDETLWSLDQVIERAEAGMAAFFRENYPLVTERFDREAMLHFRKQVLREQPDIVHNLGELRLRTLRLATEACGYGPEAAEQALAVFLEGRNRVQLFEETHPTLKQLRSRFPMVALTNGNADVTTIGVGHYFRATISAAHVGALKPSPRMFQAAVDSLGLAPHQTAHVGDDPETDVLGAAQFGMRAVWLNRPGMPWPDHLPRVDYYEIRSVAELPGLLAED